MERFSQTPYYFKKKNISPKGELLHSLLISSVYQITVCIMKYEMTRKSVQGDKQFEIDNMCCKRAFFLSLCFARLVSWWQRGFEKSLHKKNVPV